MKDENRIFGKMFFGIELALLLVIPFVIWWSNTPTNILNSNSFFKLLETVGFLGSGLMLFAGIPVGIIGIIMAKGKIKFRKATMVLSIINLVAGSIELLGIVIVFCAVLFGGASV